MLPDPPRDRLAAIELSIPGLRFGAEERRQRCPGCEGPGRYKALQSSGRKKICLVIDSRGLQGEEAYCAVLDWEIPPWMTGREHRAAKPAWSKCRHLAHISVLYSLLMILSDAVRRRFRRVPLSCGQRPEKQASDRLVDTGFVGHGVISATGLTSGSCPGGCRPAIFMSLCSRIVNKYGKRRVHASGTCRG